MKGITSAAVAAIALLALAGCAGLVEDSASDPSPLTRPSEPGAAMPTPEPAVDDDSTEPSPPPAVDPPSKFGEARTYKDGLEVTVAKPTKIKLPDYYESYADADIEGNSKTVLLVKLTLKIKNGTGANFDPSLASLSAVVGTEGEPIDAMCFTDVVNCGTSQTSLRPGRTATLTWAYAIPKAKANLVAIEVTPAFEYDAAEFEGAIK